jgi:hypothetical protein
MLRFLGLTVLVHSMQILAYPLVPVGVLLADSAGRLPRWLRWFETHDDLGWGAGTYEHPVRAVYDRWGPRAALIYWLWRNKAYTLRNNLRATPNYDTMVMTERGVPVPPKWGFFYWYGSISSGSKTWFECMPGISLGKFHLYLRIGWKLRPYFNGERPQGVAATGMFTGITPRSDDWDDFPIEQRPK